jgi:16S rRNA processing protein RimM
VAHPPRTTRDSSPADNERVTIAVIARPRGLRGEVIADLLTDFPERLAELRRVFLVPRRGAERELPVERCWLHQGRAVFHFTGVDTVEAAEKLRGCEVQIPLSERVELPAGQHFVSDWIGCEVYEAAVAPATGFSLLGVVRDVVLETGTPLLRVDSARGEMLIPLAQEICRRIDVRARRIEVVLPEGLRDLNL